MVEGWMKVELSEEGAFCRSELVVGVNKIVTRLK